jgi:hypothetical protein
MAARIVSSSAARRWGAGTAAVVRALIAARQPLTGVALSKVVGVSQPRVSQVLKQLMEHKSVVATVDGYAGRTDQLLDLYERRARPSIVGAETYWYSTRRGLEQARRIVDHASRAETDLAFSADLGPDLLVPWRHPTLTIVYSSAALAIASAGFVPAEGRADATVIVRWTTDRTLLAPAGTWPHTAEGIPLADPTQQWWDLLDLGGEDRREAADRLRTAILDRTIPGTS